MIAPLYNPIIKIQLMTHSVIVNGVNCGTRIDSGSTCRGDH